MPREIKMKCIVEKFKIIPQRCQHRILNFQITIAVEKSRMRREAVMLNSIVMNSFQKDPNDSNLLVIVSDLSSKCDVYVCFKAFPSFFRVKRIPSQQKLPCPQQNFPCFFGKLLKVGNKSLASLGISKGMTNWNTSNVKRNKLATPIFPTLKKSLTESTEEMLIKPF